MIIKKIDKILSIFSNRKNWHFEIVVLTFMLIQFTSFPSYSTDYKDWQYLFDKSESIFENIRGHHPASHAAKTNVRIMVPILIKMFHLTPIGLIIIKNLTGFGFLFLIVRIFRLLTNDNNLTILLTLSCAFVGFGKSSTADPRAIFDGLSLTLVLFSFLTKNQFLSVLSIIAALYNDERSMICTFLFVLLSLEMYGNRQGNHSPNRYPVRFLAAFSIFIIGRIYMQYILGITAPIDGVGINTFMNQINAISMGYFLFLEGFWIIFLYGIFSKIINREITKTFIAILIFGLVGTLISFTVIDHGRSIIYSYPLIFIGLYYTNNFVDQKKLKKLIIYSFLLSILIPTYGVGGKNTIWMTYSLPIQIVRMIVGRY